MNIKSVYSDKSDLNDAVNDIKNQLDGFGVKTLIYFASSFYDHASLSKILDEKFQNSTIFGCTTAGEITSGKMLKKSVVAMAINSEIIEDIKVEVIQDLKDTLNVKKAFDSFSNYFHEPMSTADIEKYVGIVLIDGLSLSEESIMEKIGDQTNVVFVGGSAGDDLKFEKTLLSSNGISYSNAAVLAVLKLKNGYDIIKTQSFEILDKELLVTKANEISREVLEFDNKPATTAYAEKLGVSEEELSNHFMTNPLGLKIGSDIYVRSPQKVNEGNIVFYCNILENMHVSILKSKDIVKETMEVLEKKVNELGSISGILNFNCILRTLELEQIGQCEDYGKIFSNIPTTGFSTYGEEYIGHINQTATMIVFK